MTARLARFDDLALIAPEFRDAARVLRVDIDRIRLEPTVAQPDAGGQTGSGRNPSIWVAEARHDQYEDEQRCFPPATRPPRVG